MYCKAFHGEKDIADFTVELIFCNICPKTDCGLTMLSLRWVGCIPCADHRILFCTYAYMLFLYFCATLCVLIVIFSALIALCSTRCWCGSHRGDLTDFCLRGWPVTSTTLRAIPKLFFNTLPCLLQDLQPQYRPEPC